MSLALGTGLAVLAMLAAAGDAEKKTLAAPPRLYKVRSGVAYNGTDNDKLLREVYEVATAWGSAQSKDVQRLVKAFLALQSREGSVAAIQNYDNQIFTVGTGFGARGSLGLVMKYAGPGVKRYLAAHGVVHVDGNQWRAIKNGNTISGVDALREIAKPPKLYAFYHVANNKLTRNDWILAQLRAFVEMQVRIMPNREGIATQALVNFVSHLIHWAPGYCKYFGAVLAQTSGEPRHDRDELLAQKFIASFYGVAAKHNWVPSWKQMQQYIEHLKKDGLDIDAARPTDATVDGIEGVEIVTPSSTLAYMQRVDAAMAALNRDYESSDHAALSAWKDFYQRWQAFYAAHQSWWDRLSASSYNETERFERDMEEYRVKLSKAGIATTGIRSPQLDVGVGMSTGKVLALGAGLGVGALALWMANRRVQ